MKTATPRILTINGGSSSIKFALFESGDSLRRILEGVVERIGLPAKVSAHARRCLAGRQVLLRITLIAACGGTIRCRKRAVHTS